MKSTRVLVVIVSFLLLSTIVSAGKTTVKKNKKTDVCVNNLKQIGMGIMMYAQDNYKKFPAGNNITGLQKLVKSYLKRPQILICPNDTERNIGDINNLTEDNSSYIYFDIERNIDNVRLPSRIAIVFDKPGNHDGFVNVLYIDGHVMKIKTNKNYSCEAILRVIYKDNFSDPICKLQLKKAKEMDKKFGWKMPSKQ